MTREGTHCESTKIQLEMNRKWRDKVRSSVFRGGGGGAASTLAGDLDTPDYSYLEHKYKVLHQIFLRKA